MLHLDTSNIVSFTFFNQVLLQNCCPCRVVLIMAPDSKLTRLVGMGVFPVSRKSQTCTMVLFRIIITLHWNLPFWNGGLQFSMVALKTFQSNFVTDCS